MAHRVPFTANKTIKLAERGVSHDYIPSAQACVSASTNGVFRGGTLGDAPFTKSYIRRWHEQQDLRKIKAVARQISKTKRERLGAKFRHLYSKSESPSKNMTSDFAPDSVK